MLVYLFDSHGSLQTVTPCHRMLGQVTPLLLQCADPLLDGTLVVLTLFGQQILTSSQNSLVLRFLGLELRLENLT